MIETEPSITSQLLGIVFVIALIGIAYGYTCYRDFQKKEELRKEEEFAKQVRQLSRDIFEKGREVERQSIRANIRRPFNGFTFDNEKPEGLREEPKALPAPKERIMRIV